jgi:hypothetical protein
MKKFFTYFSLAVIAAIGIYAMVYAANLPRTYDGSKTSVYELQKNPKNYEIKDEDGVASIMVKKNLNETHALNAVTAVVFDFRGYDTLGESFILLTAVSGSLVILRNAVKGRAEGHEEEH